MTEIFCRMLKLLFICLLTVLWVQGVSSTDLVKNNETRRCEHAKIVMEDLRSQEWQDDEAQCVELLIKVLENVQNSTVWATWIWDSMQNPVGHLYGSRNNYGNYDECVDFPWEKIGPDMRTQYCLTRIHLSDVDQEYDKVDFFGHVNNYIRTKTKHHLEFNVLVWGVCTPVACKPNSVVKFVDVLFRQTHLGLAVESPNITVDYCDIAGESKYKFDFGFYLTLLVAVVVPFVCVLLATWILSVSGQHEKNDFLKAFHIPTNTQSLLRTADNEIKCLFGIRVISCTIMTGLHVWMVMRNKNVVNAIRFNKDLDILSLAFPLEMVVDTFLLISGLLLVKSLPQNSSRKFKPLKMITKHYIRTASILGWVLLIFTNLFKNLVRGPAAKETYDDEINMCYQNWWRTLLLVQNYGDTANMCHPIAWTTAVDFHLSTVGILICWLLLRHRRAGFLVFIMGFIISILAPAVFVYHRGQILLNMDFRLLRDYRTYIISKELHIATHLRASAYFVGMAIGYIMYKYDPVTYRNVISKKYSILGFCVSLAMFSSIFVVAYLMVHNEHTITVAILYASLKRAVWAISIGILIIMCEYGKIPLVTSFLSWTAWVPVGKLSFGIYLVHGIFLSYAAGIARSPPLYDLMGLIIDSYGIMVLSTLASLIIWIFIVAPVLNIIALTFRTSGNKEKQQLLKAAVDEQQNTNNYPEDISKKTL